MVRKKIDNRIRLLIENGVKLGHRTMFALVGDKGRDQVVILHHMLSKAEVKARPSVLWCYKKELGFSSHRKKRMKHLQHKIKAGKLTINEDDPFEQFVASTKIRYCYYSETHKILGNTYGMCVLQDFEALTPNLLARTIETVEGGGLIIILLASLTSLKQLETMAMDIHKRYRPDAHQGVVPRFNERFLLSLASCKTFLYVDDQLRVLPLSSHGSHINPVDKSELLSENQPELENLRETLKDTQPVGALVNGCKTLDQAKAVLKFIEAITKRTLRSTVSVTASRGRGKSAALGLSVAAAIAYGYSNIFVTSPSPENLNTFFEFVFKGFDALEYQEHIDYGRVESTNPEFNKAIVRVDVSRDNRQTIQYIHANESHRLANAEILVIDEAAAIPLPYIKAMLGPYLVFLSSTTNGYEGTGRSLSLKLLQQLRIQAAAKKGSGAASGRTLDEITLEESIRYKSDDAVELWLTKLLCLDATSVAPIASACPSSESCELYYINRDTLFSHNKDSEIFLHNLVALYVASHYKYTPNDIQIMSDAPGHHLFCLLGPINPNEKTMPEILVIIHVCLEGELSENSIEEGFSRRKRSSGDLIPWTISQQFLDPDFPKLYGARIVRIATHPDHQGMGYGTRALNLLKDYYEFKMSNIYEEQPIVSQELENVADEDTELLEERIKPRKSLPPLLLKLHERQPEKLHYIGVSYGLTEPLLIFWKSAGFVPVYIRQTTSDLTGEHSCIMLKVLNYDSTKIKTDHWLTVYWTDFRKRFVDLLSHDFRSFSLSLALNVLINKNNKVRARRITRSEFDTHFTSNDMRRLEWYIDNLVNYNFVKEWMQTLANLYFLNKMDDVTLTAVQSAILLAIGLQHKTMNALETELNLPIPQIIDLLKEVIRKFVQYFNKILEKDEKLFTSQKQHEEVEDQRTPLTTKRKKNIIPIKSIDKQKNQYNQQEVEVHQPKKKKKGKASI